MPCSARVAIKEVHDLFYHAMLMVRYPIPPLYDARADVSFPCCIYSQPLAHKCRQPVGALTPKPCAPPGVFCRALIPGRYQTVDHPSLCALHSAQQRHLTEQWGVFFAFSTLTATGVSRLRRFASFRCVRHPTTAMLQHAWSLVHHEDCPPTLQLGRAWHVR